MNFNKKYWFPKDQFVDEITEKLQIILHHTVSGPGVEGDMSWWLMTDVRVATHFVIDRTGEIYQCFPIENWGYHVAVSKRGNKVDSKYKKLGSEYDKKSIGIELDSWGPVLPYNGSYYPIKWDKVNKKMIPNRNADPVTDVVKYQDGYRGFTYFEKYTDAQLQSLKNLLTYLGNELLLPTYANESIFDINESALKLERGVFSHTSYRTDKSDVHPQKELVEILKSQ